MTDRTDTVAVMQKNSPTAVEASGTSFHGCRIVFFSHYGNGIQPSASG